MRLTGKGDHYYERYSTPAGLRRMFAAFDVWDYTLPVLADPAAFSGGDVIPEWVGRLPERALAATLPLVPTYVWLAFRSPSAPAGPPLRVAPRHVTPPLGDDPRMTAVAHLSRTHRPSRPLQAGAVVRIFMRGGGDPTSWSDRGRTWVFAWRVPTGPVTLRLVDHPSLGEVEAQAWGEGAEWMLDRLPAMLGEEDDDSGFVAHHDVVAQARRRFEGWRVPASGLVVQALIPTIIEQRVTGKEAFAAYRMLVRHNGTPAPGIGADLRLVVPPEPRAWALIPSWEWLRAGVDGARSRPAVTVATRAGRLEETVGMPWLDARRRIESLPGVGRWSSAEVAQRALGDPDAVSLRRLPRGQEHRLGADRHTRRRRRSGRACSSRMPATATASSGSSSLAGAMRPRRGPRFTLPTHLPGRRRGTAQRRSPGCEDVGEQRVEPRGRRVRRPRPVLPRDAGARRGRPARCPRHRCRS